MRGFGRVDGGLLLRPVPRQPEPDGGGGKAQDRADIKGCAPAAPQDDRGDQRRRDARPGPHPGEDPPVRLSPLLRGYPARQELDAAWIDARRSEERRVGKESVRTCSTAWAAQS